VRREGANEAIVENSSILQTTRNKEHEKTSQSKGNGKEDEKRGGFLNYNMWYVQDRRVISLFVCTDIEFRICMDTDKTQARKENRK
jgi:hypothetical protein